MPQARRFNRRRDSARRTFHAFRGRCGTGDVGFGRGTVRLARLLATDEEIHCRVAGKEMKPLPA